MDTFAAAMEAGEFDTAEALLEAMGKAIPAPLLEPAARLHVHRHRWRAAARLLGRIIDPAPATRTLRLLCMNLAEFAEHRPEVDTAAIAGPDPVGFLATLGIPEDRAASSPPAPVGDSPIAVLGIGDGAIVASLAANPPALLLTQEQAVHLLLEDFDELRAALARRDLTGPRGPIRQRRFHWHLGPDPLARLRSVLEADPLLAPPTVLLSHRPEPATAPIRSGLAEVAAELRRDTAAIERENRGYYATLGLDPWRGVFSDAPPRRPRALLITSRFTTVLRYSTACVAEAMAGLGWDARVLIEREDWQRIGDRAVARELAEFRPDVVFVIDHLRYEYGPTFPPGLVMVTWIQDQLPNVACERAGRSIGARDFVLTMVRPMYERVWGYPGRQIVDVPTLARFEKLPRVWESDGEDLVYVTNAPPAMERMIAKAEAAAGGDAALGRVIRAGVERIAETYETGGELPTLWHVGRVVDAAAEVAGVALAGRVRAAVVNLLNHPLNNALYRRQAMRWVAGVAREMGLRFGLYGRGWEGDGEFAEWARGPIEPGEPLEGLVRRSRINLQIVPSFCLHNRMLSGLAAGGFFLVRDHPTNALLPGLAAFLEERVGGGPRSLEEVRRAIEPGMREELERRIEAAACLSDLGQVIEPVNWVRACQRAGLLTGEREAIPRLSETMFNDAASLRRCVERFVGDAGLRREIALAQRRSVEARLSYPAGIGRALLEIRRLVGEDAGG